MRPSVALDMKRKAAVAPAAIRSALPWLLVVTHSCSCNPQIIPAHELLESVQRQGRTEQIALVGTASMRGKKILLRAGFHSLGDHLQAHAFCQQQNRAHDGRVITVNQHVPYE